MITYIDFRPIITKTSDILPSSHYLSIVTADKGYDSEEGNHILVREQQQQHAFNVIPARYRHVPIWKTHRR